MCFVQQLLIPSDQNFLMHEAENNTLKLIVHKRSNAKQLLFKL